jgi:hypothetical protein
MAKGDATKLPNLESADIPQGKIVERAQRMVYKQRNGGAAVCHGSSAEKEAR